MAGLEFDDSGCCLEIVHGERLVFTSVLLPGYRPAADPGDPAFTGVISLEARGGGTHYTALAIHGDVESCTKRAEMGFAEGRGKALDQLVEHARSM